MKTIANIKIVFLAFILGFSACDLLDQIPESDLDDNNFWKTQEDAQSALTGVYNSLQGIIKNSAFTDFIDLRADVVVIPSEYGWSVSNDESIRSNQISPTDRVASAWASYYLAIGRVNNVISHVKDMEIPNEAEKKRILGEAYFLRALFYFHLVRDWGDSPIITEPYTKIDEAALVKRNPEKEVFDLIISDLQEAVKFLPELSAVTKTEHIKATKYAAKSMLCNIYLERAYKKYAVPTDLEMAANEALDVIKSGKYQLVDGMDYEAIFVSKYSSESIFEIDFNYTINATNSLVNTFYPRAFTKVKAYGGGGLRIPSKKITEEYESGDLRIATNFKIVPPDGGYFDKEFEGMPYANKYPGTIVKEGVQRQSDSNFIIYRLSDIMLMRAEALVRGGKDLQEAASLLNQVRNRAGLPDAKAATADNLFRAIQKERLYELCYEGKRWYDLVRTGLLLEMRPEFQHMNPSRIYYPIPQDEIDRNPNLLPQNPTY